jgi:hypothetical protein
VTYITKSRTKSQPINQPTETGKNRKVLGFFVEKNRFWLENPKILGKIFNLEIPNRSRGNGFQRGSTLEDPRVTHAGGSKRVGEP